MKKEKLIKLLRKAYLSGVMEKELADNMIGFNHDLESMATNYAEIEVNNVVLPAVMNGFYEWHKGKGYITLKRDDFEEYLNSLKK